jgi:OOP family OmpA-OmpF porin
MSKNVILSLLIIVPVITHAQIGGILNRVKYKVNQRIDNKVDKAIDKTLDKAEGKKSSGEPSVVTAGQPADNSPLAKETLKVSSKYDFIPGTEILYYDDFNQETIGELPGSWNTNGTGEVVSLEKHAGRWLRLHNPFMYLTGNTKELSGDYTAEFDVIMQLKNNGWMYPTFSFGFFASGGELSTDNKFLKEYNKNAALSATLYPAENSDSKVLLESFSKGQAYFTSEPKNCGEIDKYYGQPIHIALQVQKQRFRMWINDSKVFDIPRGIDTAYKMNQLFFKIGQTNYKEDQYGIYITNIKAATGLPDTRRRLLEDGKFSTAGILFDLNSAAIKPESYGILKEIAAALKENPSHNVKITGHTSSDGDDNDNMELSKKRADAVKEALVNDFSVNAAGLETAGKGETQPVADNTTKEGKAANRRVEFTKLGKR